ncbi:unnamed protein product [Nyctereutes procyonoides]|uniref:(raccoon dog) hypothetical protein n=1 Tax=Nyctereutes procyonoides TaxID=34880 RepID=A0A811ZEZ1_NYCPR|nr:unnamed protein product [Nyctereutes procyonoides]
MNAAKHFLTVPGTGKRPDVKATTDWFAPIIWEGTYNRQVLEKYSKRLNITIGLAVFATGKFVDQYLQQFIHSANKHFMKGYSVIFYILMDDFSKLPPIKLDPLRTLKLCIIFKQHTWKDLNYIYMRNFNLPFISQEVDFLFTMSVNQIFKTDFGVENLGKSVAQLHARWYFGNFFLFWQFLVAQPREVLAFTEEYIKGIQNDTRRGLQSTYECYLNKYLFINKPTKLLSPEYNWDLNFRTPPQIKSVKIAWQSTSI